MKNHGSDESMVRKKIRSIFMMLIILINMAGEGVIFASQNKRNKSKKIIDNGIYVIESVTGKGKVLDICGGEKKAELNYTYGNYQTI